MLTHYDMLGVEKSATVEEIRKAYRSMSRKHHPDLNEGKGSALYSAVNEAYEVLSNPDKRTSYDADLRGGTASSAGEGANSGDSSSSGEYAGDGSEYNVRESESSAEEPQRASNTTTHSPGGIRQVKVDWSEYEWWNAKRDDPVKVVNVKPHTVSRGLIVLGYWVSLVLLGITSLSTWSGAATSSAPIMGALLGILGLVSAFVLQKNSGDSLPRWSNVLHIGWVALTIWWAVNSWVSQGVLIVAFATAVGVLGVLSGLWGAKVESERVWMSAKPRISKKDAAGFFQWGTAGDLGDAVGKFGAENIAKGVAGEKYSEKLFQELSRIPSVRIFHGLKFPGSDVADVDHAILAGDTLVFVDSKQWSPGEYSFSNTLGAIEQITGSDIYTRTTNFNRAVNGYRWLMPKRFTVYGVMLIHGVGVVVNREADSQDGIRMMNTRDGMEVLGRVCSDAESHIDLRVLNLLANSMKS